MRFLALVLLVLLVLVSLEPQADAQNAASQPITVGDYRVNTRLSLGLYYGQASGQAVPQAIYSSSNGAHLGYAELLLRF